MLRNGHVRFGGRPAETHPQQCGQGAAGRPYTEHRTREGKLYLCAIKDVFSNRIVGYSIDSRMKARIAVNALEMAVAHRGRPTGVIVHSDRGSQFRSRRFLKALKRHGLTGSMGRVGACGDNAANGVVLRAPAEERPRPTVLEHTRGTTAGDRVLDRGEVPPQTPSTPARETHPRRVRTHHETNRYTGGINPEVNQTFSRPRLSCAAAGTRSSISPNTPPKPEPS